jgi:hypothetical protein
MKKLLLFPVLLLTCIAHAQGLTIQTMCTAVHAHVGDTVELAAAATADNGYQNIVWKMVSGPNTPVILKDTTVYTSSLEAQNNLFLTGLAAGTYIYGITATDLKGGSEPGTDSIVVAAAIACPVIPPAPTFSGVTITQTIFGQKLTFTIPPGSGTVITFFYNGKTQSVTF